MLNDFSTVYAERSDEELLQLASERSSLTPQAAVALDAELHRRNLTSFDQAKHAHFVKRSKQLETKKRIRKISGRSGDEDSWYETLGLIVCVLVVVTVLFSGYAALPENYHFTKDWEETAEHVSWATVIVAIISTFWWRNVGFWLSLLISTGIHSLLLHAWIIGHGVPTGRGSRKLAVLMGIVLFLVTYGLLSVIRLRFFHRAVVED